MPRPLTVLSLALFATTALAGGAGDGPTEMPGLTRAAEAASPEPPSETDPRQASEQWRALHEDLGLDQSAFGTFEVETDSAAP